MVATRLSQLQKRILRWLAADAQRTTGVIASSHQELVRALQGDKSHISQSLRTLEARGWIMIGRSCGGYAESVILTPKGQNWVRSFTGSCDSGIRDIETMDCKALMAHLLTAFRLS